RFDELAECCCAVFARMVDHCRRRRKRGFVDGLFGAAVDEPYAMFRSAVFYDPVRHPDCTVELMSGVRYRCRAGRWSRYRPHRSSEASAELGDILHETDRVLRARLGGFPELKEREVPKYVRAIVAEEVGRCLDRRAAEEAARVRIDRSALVGIRAAHERTREALLVDEEREDAVPDSAVVLPVEPPVPAASSAPAGLSAEDAAYLRALLDGVPAEAPGGMPSLAADRINEALFDLVGDTVIEFEGDVPRIVEDYADDVREALS
ncbi:MAG: tellurite resistance TerB C-terminal domain-containing protein, partial [Coriobacteriaceae bacterium]|nr:tellurite resistance TerB C-terminal domain-containing protein [Coriobacteriaceae bacterium]